jgi:hypothetical protein
VPTCEMLSLDLRSPSVEGMCMAAEIMEADVVGNILDVACGDSERYSFPRTLAVDLLKVRLAKTGSSLKRCQ